MKKDNIKSRPKPTLRGRAEVKLKKQKKEDRPADDTDLRKLLHELQVHQVELEMQNEELRRAQQELEVSRSKYVDLYDFAPLGYFTLDSRGTILEANLTGAAMLGVERSLLVKKPFVLFVAPDSQDLFSQYRRQVFSAVEIKNCDIKLKTKDGKEFFGYLESIALEHKGAAGSCSSRRTMNLNGVWQNGRRSCGRLMRSYGWTSPSASGRKKPQKTASSRYALLRHA
jgi:PAS domain S-box-containing protein